MRVYQVHMVTSLRKNANEDWMTIESQVFLCFWPSCHHSVFILKRKTKVQRVKDPAVLAQVMLAKLYIFFYRQIRD